MAKNLPHVVTAPITKRAGFAGQAEHLQDEVGDLAMA